jgi:hypothetical protein
VNCPTGSASYWPNPLPVLRLERVNRLGRGPVHVQVAYRPAASFGLTSGTLTRPAQPQEVVWQSAAIGSGTRMAMDSY